MASLKISSSELFDASILPNKIEIFEGDESYAFVMLTQALQPSVRPFVDVADLAIQEVRNEKANLIMNDFAKKQRASSMARVHCQVKMALRKKVIRALKDFLPCFHLKLSTQRLNHQ
jgi:hypothetical protein